MSRRVVFIVKKIITLYGPRGPQINYCTIQKVLEFVSMKNSQTPVLLGESHKTKISNLDPLIVDD